MPASTKDTYFAVSAPGLEPFTRGELESLGLVPASTPQTKAAERRATAGESGGVTFKGDLEALYRANLHLRTASRVLVRLGDFQALTFAELRHKASQLPWERFIKPFQAVAVRATCHKSRLYHSDAVVERIAGAVSDRLGKPSPCVKADEDGAAQPPQLIVVRLANDQCTVSIDSSGALLHRRGYRLETAKAPLRETLAAGLLLAAGWNPDAPLLDPFCGSGTIAIEAALLRRELPPGRRRHFAFMDWPGFDGRLWTLLLEGVQPKVVDDLPPILASDRDAGAIEIAQANAERAGVAGCIQFSCRAMSAIEPPPGPGWVVTNPPYGLRVSANKDLRNLYAQLGNVLRRECAGWQAAILCNDLKLLGHTGLRLDTSLGLTNGGVSVRLGRGPVA